MGCNCSGSSEINTSTCAETPCVPQTVGLGCQKCGCGTCQCDQSSQASPTPYYNASPGIQECHKQVTIQQSFVTSISTSSSFNMPACNATGVLILPGLQKIQVGSYLWNATYGYLKVISFDYLSSQVVITNECQTGNASPGTAVPACTLFNVVDPPCASTGTGQIGVFLAVDFIAPNIGNCIDIQVTGIAGLTIGQNVQVGSGVYNLTAIISPTIITICNTGSGVVHGTLVQAKDTTGQYITPITPLSTNACDNAAQTSGAILTCHNGTQAPLDALAVGMVPVVTDATTNEVQFQLLDVPTQVCTTMTSCLNLLNGVVTYTIVVADSSVFNEGELIVIQVPGYEDARWVVQDITNPTHIVITKTTPQTTNDQIGCNQAPVCVAPCCEQILNGFGVCKADWSTAFKDEVEHVDGANETGTLTAPGTKVGATRSVTVTNNTCNPMTVLVHFDYLVRGYLDAATGDYAQYGFNCYFGADTKVIGGTPAPVQALALDKINDVCTTRFNVEDEEKICSHVQPVYTDTYHQCATYTVAPGYILQVDAHAEFQLNAYPLIAGEPNICMCFCTHDEQGVTYGTFHVQYLETKVYAQGLSLQQAVTP